MAQFITTKRITAELEDLIKKADKAIFLVSYNFQIADEYMDLLEDAAERNVKIHVASGLELNNDTLSKIKSLKNVQYCQFPNLHAKIFMNGKTCLIGSMNFSEASERNKNIECGIVLSNPEDDELYHEAANEVHRIFRRAKKNEAVDRYSTLPSDSPGYCIRCKKSIPFNIGRPMCYECYGVWDFYGDPTYPEKYCHFSGEYSNGDTNIEFPVLNKNWKKSQNVL
ncbi:MAG: phospholipase D-like domain-containing protein [Crocinitomicaceae bacterium]